MPWGYTALKRSGNHRRDEGGAVIMTKELDEINAMKLLIQELAKGEDSVKDGWISMEEVEKRLGQG